MCQRIKDKTCSICGASDESYQEALDFCPVCGFPILYKKEDCDCGDDCNCVKSEN